MKTSQRVLLGILVVHVALGVGYSLVTPIFEPPDEANHYLFARYLQRFGKLPVQTLDPNGPRAHHPPLYFALAAWLAAWVPNPDQAESVRMPLNPHVWFRYGDPQIDNKAMYVHSAPDERWPYAGQALAVHVMRLTSLLFSALAVVWTYGAALELRPGDTALALLSAGVLAFNTMVLFMAGTVQNSTAALTSGAAVLWALSWGYRRGLTLKRWLVVGTVWAFGILLQASALTLAVCIGLIMVAEVWRTRRWRTLLEGCIGVGGPVLVLAGWWFWRNFQLYGDFTANSTIAALWTYGPIMPLSEAFYLIATGLVGRVGQGLMIDFPGWIYWAAGVIAVAALAGLIGQARRTWVRAGKQAATWSFWLAPERALWVLHASAILVVTLSLFYYMYFYIHGLHGRYLFTVFPSMAILLAGGGLQWRGLRRPWAAGLSLGVALALPVYALVGLLLPTYAPPRTPTDAELQRALPVDATIGQAARITGYSVSATHLPPGSELAVTVYWTPLSRTTVPYTVFLHLLSPELGSLAQVDTYPGLGNWATTVWDVGRTFADTYRLTVPADTPPQDEVLIIIGLYNEQDPQQTRLPVSGPNAGAPDENWVVLGSVIIQP